jgi:hypothetical protein
MSLIEKNLVLEVSRLLSLFLDVSELAELKRNTAPDYVAQNEAEKAEAK